MKLKIKIFIIALFINLSGTIFVSADNIGQILHYIKTEVDQYSTFPDMGWWQIESSINKKYKVIIPNNLLADAQKYYVQLIIDKNIGRFASFENFAKAHNFPKNMLEYSADYFAKARTAALHSGRNQSAEQPVDINAYNPYMQSESEEKNQTGLIEKKTDKPAETDGIKLFNQAELEQTNSLLKAIRRELSTPKTDAPAANIYNENQELEKLKTTLDYALNTISKLNDTIKHFISNVDSRYDKIIQNTVEEYRKLQIQINAANKIIADIAQYYYNLLDENSKRNLNNIVIDDSRMPSDNLLELSFIIREYQKSNVNLSELLQKAAKEIEALKLENKSLNLRINVEYEKLLKENNELKKKLLLKRD